MRTDDIVSTCSPLIYLTTLPDDVVVGDISPILRHCMIAIDRSDDLGISFVTCECHALMMDDDTRDLFHFLHGDAEWVSVFTIFPLYDLSTHSEILLDELDSSIFGIDGIELGLGFWTLEIFEVGCLSHLPDWTIRISEGFIGSPPRTRYDAIFGSDSTYRYQER